MSKLFRISQRHYDIIIKQAQDNYPQESGGFLGGKDLTISAILPAFNQHLFNKTDTYAITSEDIERAHAFFKKHGLTYYGVYHTHPNGPPYPSKEDIDTKQQYHFIVGLQDVENPKFAVWEIINRQPVALPLQLVSNNDISVVDIHTGSSSGEESFKRGDLASEAGKLGELMDNIRNNSSSYEKFDSNGYDQSDFTTFA